MSFIPITEYSSLIFDCDGVILNSNRVKTEAFYQACLPYGKAAAAAMVEYHIANGGISRYKKFAYFLEFIVPAGQRGPALNKLLESYAKQVYSGLLNCEVASGLGELRTQTPNARWFIISGGDQVELRDVFSHRALATLFDGGIFGSPDTKENILSREIECKNILFPAIFLGDSKYDYKAARSANIDFVFLTEWTDVKDHHQWCKYNEIKKICCVSDL